MKKDITYTKASIRLEEIINTLDRENPSIDELTKLVAEAVELSKFCKEQLKKTDQELEKLISELDNND